MPPEALIQNVTLTYDLYRFQVRHTATIPVSADDPRVLQLIEEHFANLRHNEGEPTLGPISP